MQEEILSMLVDNHFGVLTKITGLFGRRGFNIKALSVGETENPEVSRITILTEGDSRQLGQIYRQVLKLEEVRRAAVIPKERLVMRELLLIKIRLGENPEAVRRIVRFNSAKICTASDGCAVIELCAVPSDISRFIELLRPFGIIEMSRTGVTALESAPEML